MMQAFLDAAICFFIPFLAASPLAERSTIDIFSVGKTIFICMLGVVTSEIMIVARYWTAWFAAVCTLSYVLVYPYVLLSPVVMQSVGVWDMENSGVGVNIMSTPFFWVALITVYTMTFTIRCVPTCHRFLTTICRRTFRTSSMLVKEAGVVHSTIQSFGDSIVLGTGTRIVTRR